MDNYSFTTADQLWAIISFDAELSGCVWYVDGKFESVDRQHFT